MSKIIINSDSVPSPIGPYSQAVCFGNIIYTSGQIALDADSGMLVNSNIDEETKKVMHNLENLLREAGSNFSKVLKTSIFLKDMEDFAAVNAIYASYFEHNFPARETISGREATAKSERISLGSIPAARAAKRSSSLCGAPVWNRVFTSDIGRSLPHSSQCWGN